MARIRPGAARDPAPEARAGRRSSEVRVRKRTDPGETSRPRQGQAARADKRWTGKGQIPPETPRPSQGQDAGAEEEGPNSARDSRSARGQDARAEEEWPNPV